MSLSVAISVREEKRGYVCERGIVCGRNVEFEEVEDAESSHKKAGPPKAALIVGKYYTESETDSTANSQEEATYSDTSERAVSARKESPWESISFLDLYVGSLFCSQFGIQLGRPFPRLGRPVYGERYLRVRRGRRAAVADHCRGR